MVKWSNILVIELSKREKKENGEKAMQKRKMTKTVSKLIKDIKPQF